MSLQQSLFSCEITENIHEDSRGIFLLEGSYPTPKQKELTPIHQAQKTQSSSSFSESFNAVDANSTSSFSIGGSADSSSSVRSLPSNASTQTKKNSSLKKDATLAGFVTASLVVKNP